MLNFFDVNIIANRIKSRREQKGLTQDELAKLVDFSSRSSINKIENPQKNTSSENEVRDITIGRINKIAKALETSSLYIVGIINDPELEVQEEITTTSIAADSGTTEDVSFLTDEEE